VWQIERDAVVATAEKSEVNKTSEVDRDDDDETARRVEREKQQQQQREKISRWKVHFT